MAGKLLIPALALAGVLFLPEMVVKASAQPPLKDFTNLKLADFDIPPVTPLKDLKSGFITGGKNTTALIRTLTQINGISIADLEKEMRPEASSQKGFLGRDEKLLEVLAADNQYVVEELGLTHQELARHLHALGAIWRWQEENKQKEIPFLYRGGKYKVTGFATRGTQPSPFHDGTKSGSNITVFNLNNGKKLDCALLVPYLIERYGFYEGQGTSYRVAPGSIVDVFDFLKKKKN